MNIQNEPKNTIVCEKAQKIINIEDKNILVEIWDTAGQERYKSMISRYIQLI